MKKIIFISSFLIFGALATTFAQATPRVHARQGAQQGRIAEGVQQGKLSPKETKKLEMQQRHINRTKRQAKADGVVTPQERRELNRKQNRASKNIAKEKRN